MIQYQVNYLTSEQQMTGLFPIAEDNTDYQEYLEWAKTNTAEAAD